MSICWKKVSPWKKGNKTSVSVQVAEAILLSGHQSQSKASKVSYDALEVLSNGLSSDLHDTIPIRPRITERIKYDSFGIFMMATMLLIKLRNKIHRNGAFYHYSNCDWQARSDESEKKNMSYENFLE